MTKCWLRKKVTFVPPARNGGNYRLHRWPYLIMMVIHWLWKRGSTNEWEVQGVVEGDIRALPVCLLLNPFSQTSLLRIKPHLRCRSIPSTLLRNRSILHVLLLRRYRRRQLRYFCLLYS